MTHDLALEGGSRRRGSGGGGLRPRLPASYSAQTSQSAQEGDRRELAGRRSEGVKFVAFCWLEGNILTFFWYLFALHFNLGIRNKANNISGYHFGPILAPCCHFTDHFGCFTVFLVVVVVFLGDGSVGRDSYPTLHHLGEFVRAATKFAPRYFTVFLIIMAFYMVLPFFLSNL